MKFIFFALGLGACSAAQPPAPDPVTAIYWSDGDSGRIDGMDFRLADVDAPETGGVGAAIGGAECERERERGFEAKEFVVEMTRGADLQITHEEAPDRYGRTIIALSANGEDVARAAVKAGFLQQWPHDGARSLTESLIGAAS